MMPGVPIIAGSNIDNGRPPPVVGIPSQVALPSIAQLFAPRRNRVRNRKRNSSNRRCPPCNCRTCTPSRYSNCSPCHRRCSCRNKYNGYGEDDYNLYQEQPKPFMGTPPQPVRVVPFLPPTLVRHGIHKRRRRPSRYSKYSDSDESSDDSSGSEDDTDTDNTSDIVSDTDEDNCKTDIDCDGGTSSDKARYINVGETSKIRGLLDINIKKRRKKLKKKTRRNRYRRMMSNSRNIKPILSYASDEGNSNLDSLENNGLDTEPVDKMVRAPNKDKLNFANTKRQIILKPGSVVENLDVGKKELIFNPLNKKIANLTVSFQLI